MRPEPVEAEGFGVLSVGGADLFGEDGEGGGKGRFVEVGKLRNVFVHEIYLGGDGHAGYAGGGFWDGVAVGDEAFDVEDDSFADELLGGFVGWASYAETGKFRGVGAPAGRGLLEDDSVAHVSASLQGLGRG